MLIVLIKATQIVDGSFVILKKLEVFCQQPYIQLKVLAFVLF